MSSGVERKSNIKLNALKTIEKTRQEKWRDNKYFEVDAPAQDGQEKYFVTFPYPYMNGRLHLGHAYSLTKCDFVIGYQRLLGKRTLFPFGLHCTGMPIKACADKIKQEIEEFGFPPKFPEDNTCDDQGNTNPSIVLNINPINIKPSIVSDTNPLITNQSIVSNNSQINVNSSIVSHIRQISNNTPIVSITNPLNTNPSIVSNNCNNNVNQSIISDNRQISNNTPIVSNTNPINNNPSIVSYTNQINNNLSIVTDNKEISNNTPIVYNTNPINGDQSIVRNINPINNNSSIATDNRQISNNTPIDKHVNQINTNSSIASDNRINNNNKEINNNNKDNTNNKINNKSIVKDNKISNNKDNKTIVNDNNKNDNPIVINRQWNAMRKMALSDNEIKLFTNPQHWLKYFPPLALIDLKSLGVKIDMRRSFITTDINPYYDSFVKWQFNHLKSRNRIKFGRRYCIYSPKDAQPCMDHDRAVGEGVGAQESLIVLYKLITPSISLNKILNNIYSNINLNNDFNKINIDNNINTNVNNEISDLNTNTYPTHDIYFLAATMRPETLFGTTNLFVNPEINYIISQININSRLELVISNAHALRNLSYQGLTNNNTYNILGTIKGLDLIGTKINAPLSVYNNVFILPMFSIKPDKGTGIVVSVPSDSPDDFAAFNDLKTKEALRRKFFIEDDMVLPFNEVPIIRTEEYGDLIAPALCKILKVQSQNDPNLRVAKEKAYKVGFYQGRMLVEPYCGEAVAAVKPLIKQGLIAGNQALVFMEPESKVVSRSGDECVVALCDQWYLAYGEALWKQRTRDAFAQTSTNSDEVRHNFSAIFDWLHEHACSRSYGLGSVLPWDEQYLIESLSDSTIYMAYYTICHILQGFNTEFSSNTINHNSNLINNSNINYNNLINGNYNPSNVDNCNNINNKIDENNFEYIDNINNNLIGKYSTINPSDLTNEVWDFIFMGTQLPNSNIPKDTLLKMRREFLYWYPLDLRVSGKDLIPNHLTYCLYNHVAIWPDDNTKYPRAFNCHGYLMLNSEKMSKSTGNFLTLADTIERYGADATRLALADAGDSVEDANFVEKTADSAVLRIHKFIEWVNEMLNYDGFRLGEPDLFIDKVFSNEINRAIVLTKNSYDKMLFRDVLKFGLFEFQAARDSYKELSLHSLHKNLIYHYIEVQCLLLSPICPHICDHIYELVKEESIMSAKFPQVSSFDHHLHDCFVYLETAVFHFRNILKALKDTKIKKKQPFIQPTSAVIYIREDFNDWQQEIIALLKKDFGNKEVDNRQYAQLLRTNDKFKGLKMPKVMSFLSFYKAKLDSEGVHVLDSDNRVNELKILTENSSYIKKTLEINELSFSMNIDESISEDVLPYRPIIVFKN